MTEGLNIAFAGTPGFAENVLKNLINDGRHTISLVLSQPNQPSGRGRKMRTSPVVKLAELHKLPVVQPRNRTELNDLASKLSKLDAMVVTAYGMILTKSILSQPRYGCINIHTSLLPSWRGAAPIQHAILAGDNKTGITIIKMDAGLDTGDILHQKSCLINKNETAGSLEDKLAKLGGQSVLTTLEKLSRNQTQPKPQKDHLATYAKKINKQDARIDWSKSANEIDRFIRAMNPSPVAFTELNNCLIRVWAAEITDTYTKDIPSGTVLSYSSTGLNISTKDKAIRILKLQLPGKKILPCKEFYNGYPEIWPNGTSI